MLKIKNILLLIITNYSLLVINCYTQPTLEWAARYQRPPNSGAFRNYMALDKLGNIFVLGRISLPVVGV